MEQVSWTFQSKPSDQTHQCVLTVLSLLTLFCRFSYTCAATLRSSLGASELNQQEELKGDFLLRATYCCFVWSSSVSAQLPVSPRSRTKLVMENWEPPCGSLLSVGLRIHFTSFSSRPPQHGSHELSLHYAEMLSCWSFTEESSCDVSCSSIAQHISTKTPGWFSTGGWKFHRLAEISAVALPLVLEMI